jgi:hypothetical protein
MAAFFEAVSNDPRKRLLLLNEGDYTVEGEEITI